MFLPGTRFLYVNYELKGEIASFAWDARTGRMRPLQTISTFPASYPGERSSAEMALSPDGRFLYASNRGEDAIVAYAINRATGALSEIQRLPCGGKVPWSFALDPSGHWLIVANEVSSTVTVFKIDTKTGKLTDTHQSLAIPDADQRRFPRALNADIPLSPTHARLPFTDTIGRGCDMKILARALGAIFAVAGASALSAQAVPQIAFDAVDFLKPPPDMHLGEIAGVAVDKQSHVYVFQRGNTQGPAYAAAAAQLLEFDHDGKFMREIGQHLYAWSYAHNVRIDPAGNIWAADKGSNMVIKFSQAGRVMMVFGRKPEASAEEAHALEHPHPPLPAIDGQFREVTDMAWDSQGNTYISDGYINSRVAKVGPDGQWLGSWGSFGKAPGQFNTLHSIQVDANDQVYVADRGNRRIQVFDTNGKLLRILKIDVPAPADAPVAIGNRPVVPAGGPDAASNGTQMPGAPWALCITPKGPRGQFLYVADAWPGRIYKLTLDGKVLGWLGGSGKQLKQFGWIHEIACPSENELYVGELLNWRLQKLTLHPAP